MQAKSIPSLALVLSLLALSFSGDLRPMAATRSTAHWPPHPSNIVNLSAETAGAPATLLPQQFWSAYVVPAGFTLVVTAAQLEGEEMALGEFLGSGFSVRRRGTGSPSTLSGSGADPGAPLGWVFASGSQVSLQNLSTASHPLDYQLVGYLVRN